MNIGTFLGFESSVFTPWMSRQADNAIFTFELIDNPGQTDITITPYTRDREDYGAGTPGTPATIASGGPTFAEITVTNMEEMIRFLIEVDPIGGGSGSGIIYRMLEPTWYDEAKV